MSILPQRKPRVPKWRTISVGQRFGRWLVIGEPFKPDGKYHAVLCRCDCGAEKVVPVEVLVEGQSKSCGCLSRELSKARAKHGDAARRHALYWVWHAMKQRCGNPNHPGYADYGGRGIYVCSEWASSYITFKEWAESNGYREGLEIDRVNNNGNYEPANCRWANRATQTRNTRQNVVVTAFGEAKTLTDWANDPRCLVTASTLSHRLALGLPPENAITDPPRNRGRSKS